MASFDADSHAVKAKTDPAEFERQKWETDVAFRERELKIKEAEGRPKFYQNPVLVSALGLVGMGYGFVSGSTAGGIGVYWSPADYGRIAGRTYIAWCLAAISLPVRPAMRP